MNALVDIICFAKDWNEPATSVNHVMTELAQRHRVLWINSIGMRSAKLTSAGDWKKIFRKLRGLFRGIQRPHDNIRVVTPVVIPFDLINPMNTIDTALETLVAQGQLKPGHTVVVVSSILVGNQIADAVQMRVVS